MPGLEIELKAGLDPASARLLVRRLNRSAGRSRTPSLAATYFDTADRRLARAGLALRVRREGRAWIQTVKWARTGEGGFHAVQEAEGRVAGPDPDLDLLGDPMLRSRLEVLLGGDRLTSWFTTTVRRRIWTIRHARGLVEVALDTGHIEAGALAEPILEAEFELKQGDPEAVFLVAADLLGDLPVDLLLPSKAARGARLADGGSPLTRAHRPAPPDPDAAAADSWRTSLSVLARTVAAELHRLLTDEDPEGPHQLRVALRRLRVLERVHRPILDPGISEEIADGARRIGRLVAPLRDSDVLIDMMCQGGHAGLSLADALGAAGSQVRKEVRELLRAAGASAFAIRLLQLANLGGWQRASHSYPVAVGQLLDRRMARQWKALKRLGDRLSTLDEDARHEFRKDVKKMRYLLELYAQNSTTNEFRSRLKKLQEALGQLNDLHVLELWVPSALPAGMDAKFATARATLVRAADGKADLSLGRACRHWRTLSALERPLASPALQPRPEPSR